MRTRDLPWLFVLEGFLLLFFYPIAFTMGTMALAHPARTGGGLVALSIWGARLYPLALLAGLGCFAAARNFSMVPAHVKKIKIASAVGPLAYLGLVVVPMALALLLQQLGG